MKEFALYYNQYGYNCSQCILMAAKRKFGIHIDCQTLRSCSAINNGFGYGGLCCALVAGILLLGILFEEGQAKCLRMELLDKFQETFQSLNCAKLCQTHDCTEVIAVCATLLEEILVREGIPSLS